MSAVLAARWPLSRRQAVERAAELHADGMPWPGVAVVMADYHGFVKQPDSWRHLCTRKGLAAPNERKRQAALRQPLPWVTS